MITIISDTNKEAWGSLLYEQMKKQNIEVQLVSASNRNIKPCFACNGCVEKTFGKCVVRDDMDEILPKLAVSETLVYTTPVKWGAPSYDIKKLLDKTALLGNRLYKVRHGEMVKGVDHSVFIKKMVLLGVTDEKENSQSLTDFVFWGKEVTNIMDLRSICKTIPCNLDEVKCMTLIKEIVSL